MLSIEISHRMRYTRLVMGDAISEEDLAPTRPSPTGPAGRRTDVATMRDIAKAAGVSQSTVSRVLSGATSGVTIGPDTRDRVLAVAQDLGYRPNPLARGLRGASTMLLGVIVREIMDPFFATAIDAVTTEATARGYNVVLGHAHGRAAEAIALRGVLETRHCDAIVILGDVRDQPRLIDDLRASRVPAVALWQGSGLPGIATVNVDNRAGVVAALEHLTALGHRRVAFIAGRLLGDIQARRTAYLEFMEQAGLTVDDRYVRPASNDPARGAAAMEALMRLDEPPTAVLASTDLLAIGALHAAQTMGRRVPDDVSVVGFDDIPLARYTVPSLTTVRMPVAAMAATAVRIALDDNGGEASGDDWPVHVLQPDFVIRASVAPPSHG
jgi:DNA-binding LacI/PurR family transcriptional regulator